MSTSSPSSRDIVLLGGRVLTMQPGADAGWDGVVVRGARIIRLIRRADAADHAAAGAQVIDLGARTLMPGFVDVHAHAEVVCRTGYNTVDCRAPECGTIADVLDALTSQCVPADVTPWIVGQANLFFDRKLKDGRLPTRAELDRVSRDRPVALRAGGHITVLNTKALEVAKIDKDYVAPAFSITGPPFVERDGDGTPTGVVKEMDTILPLPQLTHETLAQALDEGLNSYFTRYGVTTIGEISETVLGTQCLDDLATDGRLPLSMRLYLWAPGMLELDKALNWPDHFHLSASERQLRVQGIKLFSDGGFSARSAAVNCCYVGHPGFSGSIAFQKYFFRRAYRLSQEKGLQLSVHANGDRAQDWLSETVIKMGGAASGRTRMRIEHAGNLMPRGRTADLWAEAGVLPVPQPVFIYTFGEYFEDYLGEYGTRGRFPFRTLLDQGWRLSGSSDVWIGSEREATNPFFSIWNCLKRQTYSGTVIDPHEAVTLEEALRMHTLDAALTMGEDDVRGSLAPGKYADIIALDRDPFTVDVDELRAIQVDYVMSLGRTVKSTLPRS